MLLFVLAWWTTAPNHAINYSFLFGLFLLGLPQLLVHVVDVYACLILFGLGFVWPGLATLYIVANYATTEFSQGRVYIFGLGLTETFVGVYVDLIK